MGPQSHQARMIAKNNEKPINDSLVSDDQIGKTD